MIKYFDATEFTMAARGQGDTRLLLGRARRVRQRLHQGVPEGWTAGR